MGEGATTSVPTLGNLTVGSSACASLGPLTLLSLQGARALAICSAVLTAGASKGRGTATTITSVREALFVVIIIVQAISTTRVMTAVKGPEANDLGENSFCY